MSMWPRAGRRVGISISGPGGGIRGPRGRYGRGEASSCRGALGLHHPGSRRWHVRLLRAPRSLALVRRWPRHVPHGRAVAGRHVDRRRGRSRWTGPQDGPSQVGPLVPARHRRPARRGRRHVLPRRSATGEPLLPAHEGPSQGRARRGLAGLAEPGEPLRIARRAGRPHCGRRPYESFVTGSKSGLVGLGHAGLAPRAQRGAAEVCGTLGRRTSALAPCSASCLPTAPRRLTGRAIAFGIACSSAPARSRDPSPSAGSSLDPEQADRCLSLDIRPERCYLAGSVHITTRGAIRSTR